MEHEGYSNITHDWNPWNKTEKPVKETGITRNPRKISDNSNNCTAGMSQITKSHEEQ